MVKKALEAFYVYKFVRIVTTDWTDQKAYKEGWITDTGDVTSRSKIPLLTRLAINVKKFIEKMPGGRNKIATYAAAAWLLKEQLELEKIPDFGHSRVDEDSLTTEHEVGDRVKAVVALSLETSAFSRDMTGIIERKSDGVVVLETTSGKFVAEDSSANVSANVAVPDAKLGDVVTRRMNQKRKKTKRFPT